jgi:ankyrin repeat protein
MRAENTLVQASRAGDLDEVWALLSKGFDVDFRSQDGGTALVSASWIGYFDIVQELLSKGTNVNLKSIDAGIGRPHSIDCRFAVNLLLEAGADVHEKDGECRDALMRALYGDYPHVVRALLSKGASPDAKDAKGYSALILARSADVAHLLLEAGTEVKARTHSGNTTLLFAVCGEIHLARALLAAGAHTDIRNDDGETVLATAANDKIRALLKRESADE